MSSGTRSSLPWISPRSVLLRAIAEKYELIQTGGSDFHGLYNKVPTHLGSETTSKENLDRILKLAAARSKEA